MQLLPPAYLDAVCLRLFPGRTLEELDGMDWPRLMRALQVRELDRVEGQREDFLQGKAKPDPYEWRMILRHDRLEPVQEST